jgi:hypothetical protein
MKAKKLRAATLRRTRKDKKKGVSRLNDKLVLRLNSQSRGELDRMNMAPMPSIIKGATFIGGSV